MRPSRFIAIPKNLQGRTALVRVDFNEPFEHGKIEDSFRIRSIAPAIKNLRKKGARVVLIAHLEDTTTKKPVPFAGVTRQYERLLGERLALVREYSPRAVKKALEQSHRVLLLDNVRLHKGETINDQSFSKTLASLGDMYINEAFSVSHRAHASIVGITRYLPSYAGPLFKKEVERLGEALKPKRPFLLIVGGAKFKTKFALLKTFLPKADAVFLGGLLANTFLAAHNIVVGKSIYEKNALPDIRKHFLHSKKIILPFDAYVSHDPHGVSVFELGSRDMMHDVGPKTIAMLLEVARSARLIVWNGPLGYIEGGHDKSTETLLKGLARMPRVKVILGGGDTLMVLDHLRLHQKFYHISTGGGAMLDFLADGTLPGIDALYRAQKRTSRYTT